MKHIADRNYTDLTLNKHIEKNAVLEEEYEKAGIELTEERKRYLVDERKLYKEVEEEETAPVEDNNKEVEEEETAPVVEETIKRDSNKNKTKNTKKSN